MGRERESRMMADQIKAADMDTLRARYRTGSPQERAKVNAMLGPVEVEFADIKMVVDPRDNYTETCIWLDGHPPELKSLVALVQLVEDRNVLVLDIGANCGAFTLPLAVAGGAGSRVIAFEPNPIMIGRLGLNIQLNNLTEVVRIEGCALSDHDGEAMLNFRGNNYGQASLKNVRRRLRNGGTLVPTRPLSHFTDASKNHDFTLLKIDIEGAEAMVLEPILDDAQTGGWLPDAILIEVRHAAQWQTDLCEKILASGFEETLRAEGNALYLKKK
jgi:FkbM family methyltransferase